MKKKFTFLIAALALLSFLTIPNGMKGQAITSTVDVTLSSGSFNSTNNVITWTCADGNISIQQLQGTGNPPSSTYISSPRVYRQNILSFIGTNGYTITNIAIKCDGSYYGTTKYAGTEISENNVTNNSLALTPTWSTTNGGTHSIATVSSDGLSEIYIQNGHTSDANTQLRITKITITYKTTATSYTVTYDCNGGETGCPSNLSGIEPGTSINLADAPTRAHYNFNGWKNGETTYQAGDSYTVNSSVTFTAQWESDGTYFEGSICFSNQSSCTAINSTSVTGDDGLDNTWTITTTGTSSFTANSAYYQVGSGTSPASSITFTTTLDEEVNVTDFSAAFGGFNATNATITIKVDNTTVGTRSLNGGTDVTVTNTSTVQGTTLTVIVEPTAGGVKCYNISYGYEILPPPAVAAPVISVPATFTGSTTATITCETTGAIIYYSYDNSTWTEYTAALTITETKTIYAKAVKDTDVSVVVSATTTKELLTPTVVIDSSGITNRDVYVSTTAGSLSATVKYNDAAILGTPVITWSGDNNDVATIDASTGAVTLVGAGTVNFTASFAGNTDYTSASATCQMIVTSSAPYVQPMNFDINLNNSLFGTNHNGTVSGITDANPVIGTSNNVTVTYAGSGNHYIKDTQIRFYPNNKLTFDAPSGYIITKIVFTASSWGITVKAGDQTINSSTKTCEGEASQVVFTGEGSSGNCQLTKATITLAYPLTITGYSSNTNGWHLIASPVATTPDKVINMLTDETGPTYSYDLYRYNASAANGKVWENYHQHSSDFNIVPGQGYLYANSSTVTLGFTGTPYVGDGVITMLNAGWNLVGNPYYNTTTNIGRDYYRMNSTNDGLIPASGSENVNAWEGIFVVAAQANEAVTFTKVNPEGNAGSGNNNSTVVMSLTQNRSGVVDRAIVRFDERENLPKFQLFENSTKLSLVQDNEEFAIVSTEAHGEMPVSFKANQNGQYTITVNTEDVEMGYLHLVDNMTGADIDLLNTPSYTFNARVDDYTSRFKLVFSANGMNNENGNDDFAFLSDGQLIIANDGEATLQVVDITGRILSSEVINGSCSKNIDAATGVYVIRLVNGSNVKTQKVIVK